MNNTITKTFIAATLLGLSSVSAQAASIYLSLSPDLDINNVIPVDSKTISIDEVVTVYMIADAADVGGILAGGLDLFYDDTVVFYDSENIDHIFTFDPSFPNEDIYSRPGTNGAPDNCATNYDPSYCSQLGEINGIAFGADAGLAASGPTLVGWLSFTGIANDTLILSMADNDWPAGSWYDLAYEPITDMSYVPPAVPVPAAAWLMLSGIVLLGGIARRKANT